MSTETLDWRFDHHQNEWAGHQFPCARTCKKVLNFSMFRAMKTVVDSHSVLLIVLPYKCLIPLYIFIQWEYTWKHLGHLFVDWALKTFLKQNDFDISLTYYIELSKVKNSLHSIVSYYCSTLCNTSFRALWWFQRRYLQGWAATKKQAGKSDWSFKYWAKQA